MLLKWAYVLAFAEGASTRALTEEGCEASMEVLVRVAGHDGCVDRDLGEVALDDEQVTRVLGVCHTTTLPGIGSTSHAA